MNWSLIVLEIFYKLNCFVWKEGVVVLELIMLEFSKNNLFLYSKFSLNLRR